MRIRLVLLLGLGIGIVLFGAATTMEVMGEENTIMPCLVAALIATALLQAISR